MSAARMRRRALLAAPVLPLAATVLGAATPAQASAATDPARPIPVVLVHGQWHGSWCWSQVTELLAARGIASVAVDLQGLGLRNVSPASRYRRPFDANAFATEISPLTAVNTTTSADLLIAQLKRIGRGGPCLLVAHSLSGAVATAVAERAPELVAGLVFVAAFVPAAGQPPIFYLNVPENAGELVSPLLIDPTVINGLRIDTGNLALRPAIREAFYHDVDPATADAAVDLLSSDGPLGIFTETVPVTRANFGSVPHTYVVTGQDLAVRPPLQRRFIAEMDAVSARPTTVVPLNTSHSPFLSAPQAVADAIASAPAKVV